MSAPHRTGDLRAVCVLALLGTLVASSLVLTPGLTPRAAAAVPPVLQRTEDVVTADALPTVQIDEGYVWAQTMIGDTVYAVGGFENARAPLASPGTRLTPRTNALAYDITTGELDPDWAPEVNGPVKAVAASPDGSRIYIGGSFSRVNGESRWNIAVLDAETGELVDGVRPAVGGTGVYALAVTEDTVYAGGLFTQANGTARTNVAAFASRDGALRAWAPEPDHQVDALVADPAGQDIILGGRFMAVNGDGELQGLAAVDRANGAVDEAWELSDVIKNGVYQGNRTHGGISSLSTDGDAVYGTGWTWNYPQRNLEGTFAAEAGSGALRWLADCHGDHYDVFSTGETVYAAGHTHGCSTMGLHADQSPAYARHVEAYTTDARGTLGRNPDRNYTSWTGTPAPSAYAWEPQFYNGTASGLDQAVLSITGTQDIISVGGEFPGVNGGRYQGIVRFSTDPAGGPQQGPELSGEDWEPEVRDASAGRVRVGIRGNWDRDDLTLTYELWREGATEPADSVTADSTWWDPAEVELEDPAAEPGTGSYTVVARDGDGNEVSSAPVTVQVSDGEASPYTEAVLADQPLLYYPLGDTDQPLQGTAPAVLGSGVSATAEGIPGAGSGASRLDGGSRARISPEVAASTAPTEFSTEAWIRTTSQDGGRISGFGSSRTGTSLSHDRMVYMTEDGRLSFGVYPRGPEVVTSEESYNDGDWHHVVASQSAEGTTLAVDGEVVASDPEVTTASSHRGYWRFGADYIGWRWPERPSASGLEGELDEVAVYDHALSPDRIRAHHEAGRG